MSLDFEVKIVIPADSEAWDDLLPELPQYATMLDAQMWILPERLHMVLVYLGAKANGERSVRKRQQRISLSHHQAQALLTKAYPANKRAEALSSVITTSEVDMSQSSPEAPIAGFVSSTGKKHLVGDVDPATTYVQTACSTTFAHGEQATFAVKELDCKKCRKIAGLE